MSDTVETSFKSSLPPRKRAKTQEEKEQRRVERILRNRRAAHASREKKRKHVEYLESYVLALEKNTQILAVNLHKVSELVPKDKLAALGLSQPDDISELKEKIHENLTCNNFSMKSEEGRMHDPQSKSSETDDSETNFSTGDITNSIASSASIANPVKLEDTESDLLINSSGGYFNYMSPVSISSSVNSPLDLRLKKSDPNDTPTKISSGASSPFSNSIPNTPEMPALNSDGIILGTATPGVDIMAQSSEVILHPRLLMV
ncbi:putative transcriptional activator [Clavispora lusitaniae]|uniref:Transcriptional activator n=1 Tax=Clavispora lusitaniae TaxID=36911 RepID=A0ACD0WLS8_CLALS|nr:putative transcriptional activator [Clavispora lusitaniae]QFZ34152.1 putative transcriptional activator [Clavispora lusitaniae]QFZ39836.1 putative transcriptional activator [Clavispora lusitaniae]QFZ45518.1 putative transcriptional activator [Clavispora lusitaniae]QFZ51182.1 putative transcriptional activator [Clavispora lusitaniae]